MITDAELQTKIALSEELDSKATLNPELTRYAHGGGRSALDDESNRKLVADYYHEEDREFYHAARTLLPEMTQIAKEQREWMKAVCQYLPDILCSLDEGEPTPRNLHLAKLLSEMPGGNA